jgi:hypothetical protein
MKLTKTSLRSAIIRAGVKNLKELGYPTVNKDNILTDAVYSLFFRKMLEDQANITNNHELEQARKELLQAVTKEPVPVPPKKKPRLTWKREDRETGLRAVCQGERGYDLRLDGRDLASVSPLREGGYYWCCSTEEDLGIVHKNTAHAPKATIEEAKEECMAYIKAALQKGKPS